VVGSFEAVDAWVCWIPESPQSSREVHGSSVSQVTTTSVSLREATCTFETAGPDVATVKRCAGVNGAP